MLLFVRLDKNRIKRDIVCLIFVSCFQIFIMKRLSVILFFLVINLCLFAQSSPSISIIPLPVSIVQKTGSFKINDKSVIELTSANADAKRVAKYLSESIATPTGYKVAVTNKKSPANLIRLALLNSPDKTLGDEGYKLTVTT